MVQYLDNFFIIAKNRMLKMAETFREETGVSSFVATILLIVIVVALCALFWKNIKDWFDGAWSNITRDAGNIGTNSNPNP